MFLLSTNLVDADDKSREGPLYSSKSLNGRGSFVRLLSFLRIGGG